MMALTELTISLSTVLLIIDSHSPNLVRSKGHGPLLRLDHVTLIKQKIMPPYALYRGHSHLTSPPTSQQRSIHMYSHLPMNQPTQHSASLRAAAGTVMHLRRLIVTIHGTRCSCSCWSRECIASLFYEKECTT